MSEVDIPGLEIRKGENGWPQNDKQLAFLKFYVLESLLPNEAARRAGYSNKYALVKAYKLPQTLKESVAWLRDQKVKAMERVLDTTAASTVAEIAALAMVNWKDFLQSVEMYDGSVRLYGKPLDQLTDVQARCVRSFTMKTLYPAVVTDEDGNPLPAWKIRENTKDAVAGTRPVTVYMYRLFDRNENLIHLARHFDLFHDSKRGLPGDDPALGSGNPFREIPASELENLMTAIDTAIARSRGSVVEGDFIELGKKRALQ